MNGIATSTLDANSYRLPQMVYQGFADYEYRNGKFPFRWGYERSTAFSLFFFSFVPLCFLC